MSGLIKVLLVDDSVGMREMLKYMLSASGFSVIMAEDGLTGLKTAEAERPDLIVTDIDMPNLDGIQMIARLRGDLGFSKVPILVVSSCGGGEFAAALGAGADLAIHKPVDIRFFINCINRLLLVKMA